MDSGSINSDFLIAGSGVAGLYAAWHASKYGSVVLVTKSNYSDSSSYWAQGGVAAVMHSEDSYHNHIDDTYLAGRKLGDLRAIRILVEEGASDVEKLIELGMPFDKKGESFELSLEGGHSKRRILHTNGAATGKAFIDFLSRLIREASNIRVIENAFVYNLVSDKSTGRCSGADIYLYQKKQLLRITGKAVILATGGYSGLYGRSTNPHTSTGDGLWLSLQKGTVLKDLEFIQFHPTAYYSKDGASFLITEALRGEGARLYCHEGKRFMHGYAQKELAPRDVVAKEIWHQIEKSGKDYVYLDLRHLNGDLLRKKYPDLISVIEKSGVNIMDNPIPVAPAAHYCIGGIETDLNGHTAVSGLYACGEVATTGVHGANRLASNSLLECLVFGRRAAEHAAGQNWENISTDNIQSEPEPLDIDIRNEELYSVIKNEISELLNRHAGILRNKDDLIQSIQRIKVMKEQLMPQRTRLEYYTLRANGILEIAEMIMNGALDREKSVGVHNRVDTPLISDFD